MSKKGGTNQAQGIHVNLSSVAAVFAIVTSLLTAGAMFGVYRSKIDRVHTTIADPDGAVSFAGLIRKLVEDEVFREGVVDDNHEKQLPWRRILRKW